MSGLKNRKSKSQKVIEGTYRKDRDKDVAQIGTMVQSYPEIPKGLSKRGQNLWTSLVTELINSNMLSNVDLNGLEMLVYNIIKYWEMEESINQMPKFSEREDKDHHLFLKYSQQSRQLWEQIRKSSGDYGFSPNARRNFTIKASEAITDIVIEQNLMG